MTLVVGQGGCICPVKIFRKIFPGSSPPNPCYPNPCYPTPSTTPPPLFFYPTPQHPYPASTLRPYPLPFTPTQPPPPFTQSTTLSLIMVSKPHFTTPFQSEHVYHMTLSHLISPITHSVYNLSSYHGIGIPLYHTLSE